MKYFVFAFIMPLLGQVHAAFSEVEMLLKSKATSSIEGCGAPLSNSPAPLPAVLMHDFAIEDYFFMKLFMAGKFKSEILNIQSQVIPEISAYFQTQFEMIRPLRIRRSPSKQFFVVKDVFPDYNCDTDMLIGIGQGGEHVSLLVGDVRFDGNFGLAQSWDPHRLVKTQEPGIVLLFKGISQQNIAQLKARILENQKIVDLNCWSSIVQLIETTTSLRLARKNPDLPLLPGEILTLFLAGRLRDGDHHAYPPRLVNTAAESFTDFFNRMVKKSYDGVSNDLPFWLVHHESRSLAKDKLTAIYGRPLTDSEVAALIQRLKN